MELMHIVGLIPFCFAAYCAVQNKRAKARAAKRTYIGGALN
jgi:hypothetical protein